MIDACLKAINLFNLRKLYRFCLPIIETVIQAFFEYYLNIVFRAYCSSSAVLASTISPLAIFA